MYAVSKSEKNYLSNEQIKFFLKNSVKNREIPHADHRIGVLGIPLYGRDRRQLLHHFFM